MDGWVLRSSHHLTNISAFIRMLCLQGFRVSRNGCRRRSLALVTRFRRLYSTRHFIGSPALMQQQIKSCFYYSGQLRFWTLPIFASTAFSWKRKVLPMYVSRVALFHSHFNGRTGRVDSQNIQSSVC